VSDAGRRLHLDGAVLPAMVWSYRQAASKILNLQRLQPPHTRMKLDINNDRLLSELRRLARITDCPQDEDKSLPAPRQAVTRIVFTPRDLEARAWLKTLAKAAGFSVHEDAVGNTFIRWEGSEPALGVVGTGSHTDAIP